MAHGAAWEGKWRGNWRKEWVGSTLHTTSEHDVSSITTADAHTSAASSRLNWRPAADVNGLVRFAERRNLVSVRVPSHFNWPLHDISIYLLTYSMVHSPSWEANWFAASQEIPHISRNPNVHYRTHKLPPPIFNLGQPNPVHIPTSHLLEIHPIIIHPSTPRSPQWSFRVQKATCLGMYIWQRRSKRKIGWPVLEYWMSHTRDHAFYNQTYHSMR